MEDFLSVMEMVIQPDAPSGVYNISTGESRSIKEVFDAVAKYLQLTPEEPPIVPPGEDDVPEVVLDPAVTESTLGWRARVSFEETIRRMLAWYDAHGVSAIHSHLAAPQN